MILVLKLPKLNFISWKSNAFNVTFTLVIMHNSQQMPKNKRRMTICWVNKNLFIHLILESYKLRLLKIVGLWTSSQTGLHFTFSKFDSFIQSERPKKTPTTTFWVIEVEEPQGPNSYNLWVVVLKTLVP